MRQLIYFFILGVMFQTQAQCDCDVFSKKMQSYRVKNYELTQHLEAYQSLDSAQQVVIAQQREQIIYLKNNQDSLASIPRPLLTDDDEAFYLNQLRTYYLHTGDSTKAARIKVLQKPEVDSKQSGD